MSTYIVDRRVALKSSVLGLGLVAAGASVASAADSDLPNGYRRGKLVERIENNTPIYEVVNFSGVIVGYTLTPTELRSTQSALASLDKELQAASSRAVVSPQDVTGCAIGIGKFVLQAVYPAIRIAKLALRLGKLVLKYGARIVARIYKGARGLAGRTVENDIVDILNALTGVDALRPCFQ